jgi:hypothetical protein
MIYNYYTKAPLWYVVRTFPKLLQSDDKLWPCNIFVFINLKLYLNVCIFVTRRRDTRCLSKPKGQKLRKYSSLFSTQLYTPNVANHQNCCNITLTVIVAMQSDVRNSRRHVDTDCLQGIKRLELLLPVVLLLRHECCLVKEIKSISEPIMIKNKEMEQ